MTSVLSTVTGSAPRLKWALEVQGTQLERRNLADLLNELGFELVDEAPHVAFSSPGINNCSTATEVYDIGKKVRSSFVGGIDATFALGSVIDYSRNPATRHAFLEVQDVLHAHTTFFDATLTVSPLTGLSEDELRAWHEERAEAEYQAKLDSQLSQLVPAYFNPKAAKVLELLAIEAQTGVTLFKIYELMRGPSSNAKAFGQQFGISDNEYHRFAEAVHLDSVSGDWARHAHGEAAKLGNPMSKGEAESFVRSIATRWLQYILKSPRKPEPRESREFPQQESLREEIQIQ